MTLQEYIKELSKVKLLEPLEEERLWKEYKEDGNMQARSRIIEAYQPLVFKQAMPFRMQESILDIIQEGTVGLIEAAESYDHLRGVAFSLYAVHRIRGRMLNFVLKEGRTEIACVDSMWQETGMTLKDCIADKKPSVPELAERHELTDRLMQAMDRLPAKERTVLEDVYLHSRSVQEVADVLEVSTSHIYRLQKTGVRRIRGMLSRFWKNW